MPASIRLSRQDLRLLQKLARERGETRSDVVRAAIHALAAGAGEPASTSASTAYDQLAHVIGVADSGGAGLSTDTGTKFRDLLLSRARRAAGPR